MLNKSYATREAYSTFLSRFAWTHFATFTAPPTAEDRLTHALAQTIRRLERVAQGPVRFFWVLERGSGETPHLHVLLTGTGRLCCERIARAWHLGRSDVAEFDATRGGVYYLTKSLLDPDARWDLSRQLQASETTAAASTGTAYDEDDDFDPDPPLPSIRQPGKAPAAILGEFSATR